MSTDPKEYQPIVMKVLDELSERFFIHKRSTINSTLITEKPPRVEMEREVNGILEHILLDIR